MLSTTKRTKSSACEENCVTLCIYYVGKWRSGREVLILSLYLYNFELSMIYAKMQQPGKAKPGKKTRLIYCPSRFYIYDVNLREQKSDPIFVAVYLLQYVLRSNISYCLV
ncbi:uncharacterized protein LOC128859821 [Anastrepha ludens]|uniref:uncharacterized protein LOC128859821 n=1 Tax=Anastrepha ludens TaxID=28586 RepID=UPI0023AF1B67|nr:uncharacterized protein LOC128859821 [Anastrepha ludens]